ncbi:fibronectin type III domain-containing protein [Granulosicoccaceae sp. 1_MG-2023]|nr:fibronectin type III domain-containing protein [Granulosicoccaceae sp. 1_MG-2023]
MRTKPASTTRLTLSALATAGLIGSAALAHAAPDAGQTAALTALYNATKGQDWENNDSWTSSDDACNWWGVVCDSASGTQVIKLELNNNNLQGSLPAAIGNLPYLQELLVSDNSISGSIPTEIGQLTSLTRLVMDDNMFSGEIPASIGDLTNLNTIRFGGNWLSGAIPEEIGNLSGLLQLTLHRNALVGELPGSMINLSNLTEIRLDWNAVHTSDASLQSLINSAYKSDDGTTDYIDTQTLDAAVRESLTEAGTTTAVIYWDQRHTSPDTEGGYNIYLSASENGPWEMVKSVAGKASDSTTLDGLTAGTTYYLQVRSYTDEFTDGSKYYHDLPDALESSGEFYTPASFTTNTDGDEVADSESDTSDSSTDDDDNGGGGAAWLLALAGLAALRGKARRA